MTERKWRFLPVDPANPTVPIRRPADWRPSPEHRQAFIEACKRAIARSTDEGVRQFFEDQLKEYEKE